MSRSICLGKAGDVISILPCLQAEFKETGVKPTLIVAKEYAALPKSLPWLNVEEYPGSFEHLGAALKWAKARGKVDFVPQQHSTDSYQPARKFPSFQYQQWHHMGRLHQWNELTLELPRTIPQDQFNRPTILLADHSQSSPFEPIEDLHGALVKEFPGHAIIRLSSLRLPSLLDFLPLFDAADLIVSVETSFLHLSRATATPVIALVTDHPGLWWGSGYHPRFAAHIRYKDYLLRKSELLWTARKCVEFSLTLRNQKSKVAALA